MEFGKSRLIVLLASTWAAFVFSFTRRRSRLR